MALGNNPLSDRGGSPGPSSSPSGIVSAPVIVYDPYSTQSLVFRGTVRKDFVQSSPVSGSITFGLLDATTNKSVVAITRYCATVWPTDISGNVSLAGCGLVSSSKYIPYISKTPNLMAEDVYSSLASPITAVSGSHSDWHLGSLTMYVGPNDEGQIFYDFGVINVTKGIWLKGNGSNLLVDNNIYSNFANTNTKTGMYFFDVIAAGAEITYDQLKHRFNIAPGGVSGFRGTTLTGQTLLKDATQVSGSLVVSGNVRVGNAYDLPRVDGTNGYVLTTDGTGHVSWQVTSAQPVPGSVETLQTVTDNGNITNHPLISTVSGSKFRALTVQHNLTVGDNLHVQGTSTIVPNTLVKGSVQVSGSLVLAGDVKIGNAYTLPRVDGTVNQVLRTDGAGILSWQNESGAGAIPTVISLKVHADKGQWDQNSGGDLVDTDVVDGTKIGYIYLDVPNNATRFTITGSIEFTVL